jgi:hypothetical protein
MVEVESIGAILTGDHVTVSGPSRGAGGMSIDSINSDIIRKVAEQSELPGVCQ